MSLTAIKNKVTSKVGRQVLITQKHSPTLLFGVGVVGVVTTVILASRATLKMDEVLREAEENKAKIDAVKENHGDKYSEEDHKTDVKTNKARTALQIAKLYAPAVGVGVISIGAFTGSHVILNRRNVGLTAAYAALDKGFKQYRDRVVTELGSEKDQEFRFGLLDREMAVDTDDGVAIKTVRVVGADTDASIYARWFDEGSRNWSRTPQYNQMFISAQQNYANDQLNAVGHLFLNDVYNMLGLEPTPAGQLVGWVKGNGDGYVDFGVFRNGVIDARRFVNGEEKTILLDFNVDGVVWDMIGKKK